MNDIKLIRLEKEDLELVRNWRNSDDVSKYMYTEDYITEEQQNNWFDKIKDATNSIYWIIEYNGKKLGLASITGIDKTFQSCYWAFYLGDTSVRGGGIGAKIEYNVIEYVFSVLNLNKLRCEVFTTNDKVIKMHEKYGFRREAYYREHCIKQNEKLDVVGLALLKTEWTLVKDLMREKIYGK
jgi:UDP-4-amino-4,6-dideoxy-N-acetyl-beta-L-altrosamine N-acetyltransferase